MNRGIIALVAKPWRGGLAGYVRAALEALFPGRIMWIPTYPDKMGEVRRYRNNRSQWRAELVRKIESLSYAAALFINHPDELGALPFRDNNVLWLTDDPRRSPETFAPYSRVFVSDPGYALELGRSIGGRFGGVVPFARCRRLHRRGGRENRCGVCMIANRDPKRDAHISTLFKAGPRPLVVGNYFARHPLFWRAPWLFRPRITNERMGEVYARRAVSLNVHAQVVRGGTNMRTFECAGYGIAQLVEARPGLDSLFDPGEEIAVYDDPGVLPETLAELLRDAPRQKRLIAKAAARVLSEHSYEHRIATLLHEVIEEPVLADWRK